MTGCPVIWCPSRQDLLDLTRYVARYSTSSWRPWALDCALVPWCNTIYIKLFQIVWIMFWELRLLPAQWALWVVGHDFGPICKIRYVIYLFINIIWLVVSTYPSEKYDFVSWDDDIPKIWKIKFSSKPPTRYVIYLTIFGHMPWYQSWSLPIRKNNISVPKTVARPIGEVTHVDPEQNQCSTHGDSRDSNMAGNSRNWRFSSLGKSSMGTFSSHGPNGSLQEGKPTREY